MPVAIAASGGTLLVTGSVTGTGHHDVGTLLLTGFVTGTGHLDVDTIANLILGGASTAAADFTGGNGTLTLDLPASFSGAISGLLPGDTIDLIDTPVTSATISGSTLTLTQDGGPTLTYQVAGALAGNSVIVRSDGAGGSDLVLEVTSPWDDFLDSINTLTADFNNGVGSGQIATDNINTYTGIVASAIGTLGGLNWQQVYDISSAAEAAVSTDISTGASAQQLLVDTFGLYNTIVVGGGRHRRRRRIAGDV
jgi:hypothetical protein